MLLEKLPYGTCQNCYALYNCGRADGTTTDYKGDPCMPYELLNDLQVRSNIPQIYRNAVMGNFKATPQRTGFMKALTDDIVKKIDDDHVNFIFYGSTTGIGKTHCGCVILNHYNIARFRKQGLSAVKRENLYAYYIDFADLIDFLRGKYEENFDEELYWTIRNVPLLMLDDVGSGKMSEFAIEQVNRIFNHRSNYQLSTIITTNLSIDALKSDKGIGPRAYDRVHNRAYLKKFTGETYRDCITEEG